MAEGTVLLTNDRDARPKLWVRGANGRFKCAHEFGPRLGNVDMALWARAAAVSPNGKHVLVEHADDQARLWSLTAGDKWRECSPVPDADSTACRPIGGLHGGKHLALSDERAVLARHNVCEVYGLDGNLQRTFRASPLRYYRSMAVSPDGMRLAFANDGETRVWDITTGMPMTEPFLARNPPTSMAWSPCGRQILFGHTQTDEGPSATIYCAETAVERQTLKSSACGATAVTFMPSGLCCAISGYNGVVNIFSVSDGICVNALRHDVGCGMYHTCTDLSFSPDSRLLVSAYDDRKLHVWDVRMGICEQVIHIDAGITAAVFVPVNWRAMKRQREAMFAVAIACDQRELPDGVYFPRELWSRCLDYVSWRDWPQ